MIIRKSILALAFAASCVMATLPSTMLFQGHVTLPAAEANGTKDLVVTLYTTATGGSIVWTETYQGVQFSNGNFAVTLGAVKALPEFDKPLFIDVLVGNMTTASRTPLTVAPYAKRAEVAEKAILADQATVATKAETADALVSAADKSVALKDGNGTTQLTLSPVAGIQLPVAGTVSSSMTTDPRGDCNDANRGRIVFVKVGGLSADQLCMCNKTYSAGSAVWGWKVIQMN